MEVNEGVKMSEKGLWMSCGGCDSNRRRNLKQTLLNLDLEFE